MKKLILSSGLALISYVSYGQTSYLSGATSTNPTAVVQNTSYSSSDASGTSSLVFFYSNHGAAKIEAAKSTTNVTDLKLYGEYGFNTPSLIMTLRPTGSTGGNVGIGTDAPIGKFDVRGSTFIGTSDLAIGSTGSFVQIDQGASSGNSFTQIRAFSNGGNVTNDLVLQNSGGNVGIGTTNPQGYKLAVDGNMIAEEVKVKLHANWPDYVFKPNYRLPSLIAVKNYIDQNQHLPDMPSADEVEKSGINLGEMVKLQTKKIEELTLYLIEKDKENKQQQAQMSAMQKQIEQLSKLIKVN